MQKPVEFENIEELRRLVGIDDVELRQAIRGLRVGDLVRLTLLSGESRSSGEPLLVRITRIRGPAFRGKVANAPRPSGLQAGACLAFTAAHIHSLPHGAPRREARPRREVPKA
jgi:hypothetical protein